MATLLPNPLPKSWIGVLRQLAAYTYLVRPQISKLEFPTHKDSRYCRKILSDMLHVKLIGKTRKKITYDELRSGCPVYWPTEYGIEVLAGAARDEIYLSASHQRPRDDRLEHWIRTSETHLVLDQAIAAQTFVDLPVWVNEWNKFRADGRNNYYLHVQFQEKPKKKSCSPDAAFLLSVAGLLQPVYLETDLNSSSPAQTIFRKEIGYETLWQSGKFRTQHFPQLEDHNDFIVLMITTDRWRRDRLARIAQDIEGGKRWRFAAVEDVRPETILHERIFINKDFETKRLVSPPKNYCPLNLDISVPEVVRQIVTEV